MDVVELDKWRANFAMNHTDSYAEYRRLVVHDVKPENDHGYPSIVVQAARELMVLMETSSSATFFVELPKVLHQLYLDGEKDCPPEPPSGFSTDLLNDHKVELMGRARQRADWESAENLARFQPSEINCRAQAEAATLAQLRKYARSGLPKGAVPGEGDLSWMEP